VYIVLLGLPGAGKGTQAQRLKESGLTHITTGELFRENIRQGTDLGKQAQPFYDRGDLVPNELTIRMLLDRLRQPDTAAGCLFDGYPRNLEQALALDEALASDGKTIDQAIYFKVDQEELVGRLAGRWSCPNCATVYHERNQPPKVAGVCDNCGTVLTQRADDKADVVRNRLEVNLKNLQPLLDHYVRQNKLVEIDGDRDPEAVSRDLQRLIFGDDADAAVA
jgi:adenylate kinase